MPIKDAKKRGIKVCLVSEEINSYIINTYSVQSNHGRYVKNIYIYIYNNVIYF